MKPLKAIVAVFAFASLCKADVDKWKPEYTLEVDSIPVYPAHPDDAPWTFPVPQGKSCTLSPASICCASACENLNFTWLPDLEKTIQLDGVTVALLDRSLRPTSFGELPEILDTYKNETGLIDDADKAAGKMFEFAVRVAEQAELGASKSNGSLPQVVADAAKKAVDAIEKVTNAKEKTVDSWLFLVDKAKLSGASDMQAIAANPSGLIRAAVNRMQWFKAMGGNLSDPAKARELAAAVLHDLGANCGMFDHDEKLGAEASISQGLDSFVGQAQMSESIEFKGIESRDGTIVFRDDVPKSAASAFCDALDGSSGFKDLEKSKSYFTALSERQHNFILATDFVTEVVLQGSGIDFNDRMPGWINDTSKLIRRQQEGEAYQVDSPDYLRRVSQERADTINENEYHFKVTQGKGVTIFVIGSGLAYSTQEVFDELRLEGLDREDFYYVVKPEDALPRHVSTSQILFGYGKEALSASGTPMAVLAAGTYFGVAKEADIYAVQAHWRYQRVEDDVDVETTTPQALMEAYNHVIAKVIEKGLQGKAVVVVSRSQRYASENDGHRLYRDRWLNFLSSAKEHGVTVVLGSGTSHHALFEDIPDCEWMLGDTNDEAGYDFSQWVDYNQFPEVIHARSAEADGSYSWFNGVHPNGGGPYIFAQGGDVECIRADGQVWATSQTNNAAAIVAGVAATYLADEDYAEYFAQNSHNIPMAVKRLLAHTAYPRREMSESRQDVLSGFMDEASEMCDEEAVDRLVDEYPFELPKSVPMVYNGIWGPQNACNNPPQGGAELRKRQENSSDDSSSGEDSSSEESSSDGGRSEEGSSDDSSDGGSSSGEEGSDEESSTKDEFMDLSCQDQLPTPPGKFEAPPEVNPEDQTTSQNWKHLFCVPLLADKNLGGSARSDDKMTPGMCGEKCCGAMYFALRGGIECICIAGPTHIAPAKTSEECNVPCGGDAGKMCGGEASADVYFVDQVATKEYCRKQREGKKGD